MTEELRVLSFSPRLFRDEISANAEDDRKSVLRMVLSFVVQTSRCSRLYFVEFTLISHLRGFKSTITLNRHIRQKPINKVLLAGLHRLG